MTRIHCDFCDSTPSHTLQGIDVCLDCLFKAVATYIEKDYKRGVDINNCLPSKFLNGQFRKDREKGL
jgi:hypothetical protein